MTVLQTMWHKAVIVRIRARGVFALGTVLASLLLVAFPRALALDAERRISQYGHTVWRIQDGAISPATTIAQTTDGFLWVGTAQGLMRFDGVRFMPWRPPQGQNLPGTHFSALLGSRDGSLWIGTTRGLARWKDGQLRTYTDLEHPAAIAAIIEDDFGTIWATRYGPYAREAPLCSISEEKLRCFGKKDGISVGYGLGLTHDSEGNIWFGSKVLTRWRLGTTPTTYFGEIAELAKSDGVIDVALGPSGTAWATLDGIGPQLGVRYYSGGKWTSYVVPGFDGARVRSGALLVDRRGSLWVGTMNDGVYRICGGVADHYGVTDGLSGNTAGFLFEDREGNIWVETDGGLDMFRDTALISYTTRQGVSDSHFYSVMALRNGAVLMGTGGALNILRKQDGKAAIFDQKVARQGVGPMLEDHSGVVWLGMDLALMRFQNGRIREIEAPGGERFPSLGGVTGIAQDSGGTIWVLTTSGQLFSMVGNKIEKQGSLDHELGRQKYLVADPDGGLWLGASKGTISHFRDGRLQTTSLSSPQGPVDINAPFVDSDNSLLVPSSQGLYRLNHGQVTLFSSDNGLPCPEAFNVIRDNHGARWVYTRCGMVRIAEPEWAKWIESPHVAVSVMILDALDGAQAGTGGSYQPRSSKAPDGRLWFETGVSVQVLDPDRLYENPLPPPVHIEDVIADRKKYSPQSRLRLPALTRDLEIDYTALSFVVPQKVHFQYKLEGYDRDWQDAGTRRQAFYSNLRPRSYTFRVKACNDSSVWNQAGASLDFFVGPAYYQTVWFRSLGAFLFLAVLTGLYRVRVRHLERQRDALRKSEKELRDVIDTIPALVWSSLPDGSNTYVNKRFVEYSGSSAEQTAGSGWQALIHPDDLERHAGKWMEAIATGKPHENEVRSRRSDGQYRWQLYRGVPFRDEDGNIVKWYGVTTDIEDRKRAEEDLQLVSSDLQDSKAKLEEAQRIAHVGYWEWDLTSNRVIWSDETYRIYGLRPQECPIDIAVLQKIIHPEDLEFVFRVAEEAVRGGLRTDVEHRIIRPSGELRTVHSQGDVKKDASGRPYQMFGTVQDITDRMRAEQRLRESEAYLAEAQRLSQTGSWAWNPVTGDIRYWSEMCYRVLGFDPAGSLPRFEEFFHRIHPDDQAAVRERFEKAIRDKVDFEQNYRVVHPEKGIRDIHVVGHAVLDGSSNLDEFVGTVIDVTERKRADEALQQSQLYLAEGQRVAHMGSWAFNAAGFEYWSTELFRIYGLDPSGKPPTVEEYLALVHPEDRAFMKQGIVKMLDDHLAFDFTKRIVRPDGEIRHVRCVGVPVTQEGIFQGFLGTGMDVTDQQQTVEELRLSEQYLSEAQRLAHMGSWAFNPSGFFEYWSQELFTIYGLDPRKGAPTLEEYLATVHPQDREFMANTIKRMVAERSGCDVKKRIVHPDGELRYIRCVGIPVVEGEVLKGFLGTAIDITEQELLTQELERRQAYLAEAQRLTHTGSWAINVATDEHFWSEEFFRIHEFDPKLKPAWSLIRDRVHPDDRASLDQRKKMEFTQTGWTDSKADLRIVVPDGKIKHLHTIAHPVMDASGQIIELIGTTMDVTERKRAEDSLRQSESYLAEAQKLTHTGSWAWRLADRKAVHLSTEWYRIYDFDPAQGAPTWEEYFERLHPEDRPKLKKTIECAIMEKADYDVEFRIILPNGMVKWIHTVGHPVLSDSGDLEQFAGSSTDITELKSAEQEREKLRQLEADLAHIDRVSTLGEMAATLAHEIKQPIAAAITSANSCIEWLSHEPPNLDRARAAAARIDKYGNRAAEIIDRIRSFYKKSPPQRELVDVNGIIEEMLTLLTGEATRSSIAMRTDLSAELPNIMVDRVQLQQVFMNLMLNGIEAMANSGGELRVKSETQDGQLQFSVSDTGVGLPAEKMDQIFSAFFTTKPQGSGMGLAISRSIVESHGGQLWASANPGGGATFHFTLPIQVTESSPLVA